MLTRISSPTQTLPEQTLEDLRQKQERRNREEEKQFNDLAAGSVCSVACAIWVCSIGCAISRCRFQSVRCGGCWESRAFHAVHRGVTRKRCAALTRLNTGVQHCTGRMERSQARSK
eukprot:3857367-Rhodomonas_salina.1